MTIHNYKTALNLFAIELWQEVPDPHNILTDSSTKGNQISMSPVELQKSELWEVAHKLVGFNTVSTESDSEAADYLANYLEGIGFTVHKVIEYIRGVQKVMLVSWIGPAAPDGLIICGHIDVVPFEGQSGWRTNPLEMTLQGNDIIGRGVSDMKVFIAQALIAAKCQNRGQLKRPLVYLFTCDEEIAGQEGQGSERLAKVLPNYFQTFHLPKLAMIGEPTNNAIFYTHKGYTTFLIEVRGEGGHSSMPQDGINAIDVMTDVLHIVREIGITIQEQVPLENKVHFPDSPASTFNTGIIRGGLAPNMIADTCQATVSIRVTPSDDARDLINTIQKRVEAEIVSELKRFSEDCSISFKHLISTPPLLSPQKGPFVDLLMELYGEQPLRSAPYATDGGQFQRLGINSYICGPGLLEQAHRPNESIPVKNFVSGTDKIRHIIQHWCIEERFSIDK